LVERMMGLEPTTFCMASLSGRQSRLIATSRDAFLLRFCRRGPSVIVRGSHGESPFTHQSTASILWDLGLASPGTVDSPRGLARRVSLGGIDGVTPSVSAYAPAQRRPRTNEDRERGRAPRAGELVDRRDASLYDWDRAVDVQGANRAVE
jgi:hypothetical protein